MPHKVSGLLKNRPFSYGNLEVEIGQLWSEGSDAHKNIQSPQYC